jgi:hypothetical protein
VCFVSGSPFVANVCKDCATEKCRPALQYCAGFSTEILGIATNTPSLSQEEIAASEEAEAMLTTIVGGVVGGLIAAAGLVFLMRRRSVNRRAELQVEDMAAKIIKPKASTHVSTPNPVFESEAGEVASAAVPTTSTVTQLLRTRFSFHGDDMDELDVGAGVGLSGLAEYPEWWLAVDDSTGQAGLIPSAFVMRL